MSYPPGNPFHGQAHAQQPAPQYAAQQPAPQYAAQAVVPQYAAQQPAPQYAAQAVVPPIEQLFAGFAEASVDGRDPKLLDESSPIQIALYRLEWKDVELNRRGADPNGRGGYIQFKLRCAVVESGHPERPIGSTVAIMENNLESTKRGGPERAQGNIKGWLAAALSHKMGQVIDPNSRQDWEAIIKTVIANPTYLAGSHFMVEARGERAQSGFYFIRVNASPVPELYGG